MAISFPISASSAFEAELLAVIHATSWAIDASFTDFQVEMDSREALEHLHRRGRGRWSGEVNDLLDLSESRTISYFAILREANWAAHFLATSFMDRPKNYFQIADLPHQARNAYFMDLFGLPSVRVVR
ncbi:unnamed protein product [Cuscuta epithymum]|uniref:RNase H type-1 domain-containing protein n=1 Tax=Cuscuta epithymum TaxID=186058 RepID=A0AAV0DK83_9ASTE|nr:unnamed protein product [Cuscuta epithymum]